MKKWNTLWNQTSLYFTTGYASTVIHSFFSENHPSPARYSIKMWSCQHYLYLVNIHLVFPQIQGEPEHFIIFPFSNNWRFCLTCSVDASRGHGTIKWRDLSSFLCLQLRDCFLFHWGWGGRFGERGGEHVFAFLDTSETKCEKTSDGKHTSSL